MLRWWKSDQASWLKAILKPLVPRFGEVMAISLFANILALVVPIFTLQVYDRVVQHNGISTLYALIAGVLVALGFEFLLRQARSRMLQQAAVHIDAHLGQKLYDKLTGLPLQTLESRPTSYWQSVFADANLVRSVFSGPTALLIADFPFMIIFISVILVIAAPLAGVLAVSVCCFLALTWFSSHVQDVATAKERHKSLHRENLLAELILGRATVKALRIDQASKPKWEESHATSILQAYDRGTKTDNFIAMGQSLAMLTTVAMVSVGALAIMERELTIGALIAANMLSGRIIGPMNQLLSNWKNYASCRQAVHRLDRLFHLESERLEAGIERDRPHGALEVLELSFGYDSDRPVLENISFAVQPGEIIGLVGRNGSGKTTLIKCLQGLYKPTNGKIALDNGDISQFTRKQLTDWIGYVPQECFLFEGSIRDNIVKSWPEADDAAVLRAAQMADADRFIRELPDGYATEIGEGGGRLSGGQRQRLAIARALIKDPPVLLFDEISSNLDNETEGLLAKTIQGMAGRRTVMLATHSIPLLASCHKIIVLDKGRIAMSGPARQVLARLTGKAPESAAPTNGQAGGQQAPQAAPPQPAAQAQQFAQLQTAPQTAQQPAMPPSATPGNPGGAS